MLLRLLDKLDEWKRAYGRGILILAALGFIGLVIHSRAQLRGELDRLREELRMCRAAR